MLTSHTWFCPFCEDRPIEWIGPASLRNHIRWQHHDALTWPSQEASCQAGLRSMEPEPLTEEDKRLLRSHGIAPW